MDKYISFIFIGILASIFVCQADAASAVLVRERRATGTADLMQILLKIEQLINSCKKTDTNPSSNSTNPIILFFEQHDIQCLVDGAIKIYQDLNPQNRTRTKRDATNILMDLLSLEEDIQKCKKSNPPATNSTNPILNFLNQYDTTCLFTTIMNFIKKLIPHNGSNQRARRALSDINWTDFGTCAALKLFSEGPTIKTIVDAFSPQRSKRDVDSKKMCTDFGATLDAILKFVLDFAPNPPRQ